MGFHKTLVFPDIHAPLHDERSVKAVLDFAKYFKPHRFIQLGDLCDFNSLGRFDHHYPGDAIKLEDELDAGRLMLDRLESALPKNCEKFYIGGNHEDRWHPVRARYLLELPWSITSKMKTMKESWGVELELGKRGWNWCEYGGHFELGKIIFTHGWSAGKSNAAAKEASHFPGKNVIFGHTHRHQVYGSLDHYQFPIESETIGTLSRFDLSYLRGKPATDWVHGFMVIYTKPDDMFTKIYRNIIDGKFIAGDREWGNF